MKRKANLAPVSTSQLELPFGQQGALKNLAYYIGLCQVFAARHKRWPTADATREEFRAARIADYDGQRIDRELRFPAPALEADPAYRELRERRLADGAADGVTLDALDPRYRTVLLEKDIGDLFDTITLPARPGPGAIRYATGVAAHAHGELTLRLADTLRAQALQRAGLDPDDPQVLAHSYAVRVQASDALRSLIERIGVAHLSGSEHLSDHYLLEASEQGRLSIHYQIRAGSRYAGKFDVQHLVARLAAVYAAAPGLAALRGTRARDTPPAPAVPAATAPQQGDTLREQLTMLAPEGHSLKLPIQRLSQFSEIRRALEKAGARYDRRRQQFDFEEGVDAAAVIARLVTDDRF